MTQYKMSHVVVNLQLCYLILGLVKDLILFYCIMITITLEMFSFT